MAGHPSGPLGNTSWSYADVLPYFLKAEGHASRIGGLHNECGPLRICEAVSANPLCSAFIRAGVEVGFAESVDFESQKDSAAMTSRHKGPPLAPAPILMRLAVVPIFVSPHEHTRLVSFLRGGARHASGIAAPERTWKPTQTPSSSSARGNQFAIRLLHSGIRDARALTKLDVTNLQTCRKSDAIARIIPLSAWPSAAPSRLPCWFALIAVAQAMLRHSVPRDQLSMRRCCAHSFACGTHCPGTSSGPPFAGWT